LEDILHSRYLSAQAKKVYICVCFSMRKHNA